MTAEQYYNYFEELSTKHTLLKHTPTEPHYYRGEMEDFYRDLRNRVHFPALIVESYETQFDDDSKVREGSFIVATNYPGAKDWDNIHRAIDLCERIGDELLRRMQAEGDSGYICATVEPVSAAPMLNEQNLYAGVRYTVRFVSPFEEDWDDEFWNE